MKIYNVLYWDFTGFVRLNCDNLALGDVPKYFTQLTTRSQQTNHAKSRCE